MDFDFAEEESDDAALQACPVYVAAVDLSCKIICFLHHFTAYPSVVVAGIGFLAMYWFSEVLHLFCWFIDYYLDPNS